MIGKLKVQLHARRPHVYFPHLSNIQRTQAKAKKILTKAKGLNDTQNLSNIHRGSSDNLTAFCVPKAVLAPATTE